MITRLLAGLTTLGLVLGGAAASGSASTAGGLDPSFGSGGKVLTDIGGAIPSDAVLDPSGNLVVSLTGNPGFTFEVARFRPDGSLDPSFGRGGIAQATPPQNNGVTPNVVSDSVALGPGGEIIVGGHLPAPSGSDQFGVARFTASGTPDPSFGQGGVVETQVLSAGQSSVFEPASAVLVQPDGKILAGGSALGGGYRGASTSGAVVRYLSNGSLDPSFGKGGIAVSNTLPGVQALGLDSAGDIFTLPAEKELNPQGQIDAAVTSAPIVSSSQGGPDMFLASGQSLAAESVTVVRHDIDARAQRFNPDSSLDSTFSTPLVDYSGSEAGATDSGGAIGVEPDGKVVIAGSSSTAAGTSSFGLARFGPSGALDAGFGAAGSTTTPFQGSTGANALVIQPGDGKIIAVGSSDVGGQERVALARYRPN